MKKLTDEEKKEIDDLIGYAVKKGYVDDSAEEWTWKQKRSYYEKCLAQE